jgi:hypothetical protein
MNDLQWSYSHSTWLSVDGNLTVQISTVSTGEFRAVCRRCGKIVCVTYHPTLEQAVKWANNKRGEL